jgi:hypothetical protein
MLETMYLFEIIEENGSGCEEKLKHAMECTMTSE